VCSYLYVLAAVALFCELPLTDMMYCGAWTLISQQLLNELATLLYHVGKRFFLWSDWLWLGLTVLLFLLGYAAIGLTVARWMPENGRYDVGPRQFTSAMVLLVLFEALCRQVMLQWGSERLLYPLTLLLAQLYCVTMLYLQRNLFVKSALRQELDTMNRIQAQQKEQYRLAQETIDIINRKCHDLKHQMAAMRHIDDPEERERHLTEIQDSVRIYDSIFQTGNDVLNTVLTEKSLFCGANGITIHCMADGSLLDFMDAVDIYGIVGNAMDNAAESVKTLENPEKRWIDVRLRGEGQFVILCVVNPLTKPLNFQDGLPVSTKPSDGYHGFGLKSIRHTVEKYGGCLTVAEENGCFSLKILMPRQQS
jgi:hypothetical protein